MYCMQISLLNTLACGIYIALPAFTLKWHLLVGPIAAPLRHPGVAEGGNNTKSPDFKGSLLQTSFVCIPGSLDSHTNTPSQDQTDGFQQCWCTHQDRIDYFLSILFLLSFSSHDVRLSFVSLRFVLCTKACTLYFVTKFQVLENCSKFSGQYIRNHNTSGSAKFLREP